MVYMALKEWHRAILFLEIVLTAPAKSNSSRIQVEAYKKWVLANLLARGEVVSHPGYYLGFYVDFWLIRWIAGIVTQDY